MSLSAASSLLGKTRPADLTQVSALTTLPPQLWGVQKAVYGDSTLQAGMPSYSALTATLKQHLTSQHSDPITHPPLPCHDLRVAWPLKLGHASRTLVVIRTLADHGTARACMLPTDAAIRVSRWAERKRCSREVGRDRQSPARGASQASSMLAGRSADLAGSEDQQVRRRVGTIRRDFVVCREYA